MLICSANYPVTTTAANHIYINYKPSLLSCKLGYFVWLDYVLTAMGDRVQSPAVLIYFHHTLDLDYN